MTDQAGISPNKYTSKARFGEQMLGVLRLLEPETEGLQAREVLRRLKLALRPTESELTLDASGALRYDTKVRWWSVGLSKAEFVTKVGGVWAITDKGREALLEFPDASSFGAEVDRRYDEWKARDISEKASRENWELADSVIARIPAARWFTFTDVAETVGGSFQSLGVHLWKECPPGWHRVALKGGLLSAERYGDEDRTDEQRRLLCDDGFDLDGPVPEDRHLPLGELAGILTEVKGGQRAWLVRGTSVKGTSIVPEWIDEGFMSLPASMLPMLPPDASDEDIKAAVDSGYSTLGYSQREAKFEEILGQFPGHYGRGSSRATGSPRSHCRLSAGASGSASNSSAGLACGCRSKCHTTTSRLTRRRTRSSWPRGSAYCATRWYRSSSHAGSLL